MKPDKQIVTVSTTGLWPSTYICGTSLHQSLGASWKQETNLSPLCYWPRLILNCLEVKTMRLLIELNDKKGIYCKKPLTCNLSL